MAWEDREEEAPRFWDLERPFEPLEPDAASDPARAGGVGGGAGVVSPGGSGADSSSSEDWSVTDASGAAAGAEVVAGLAGFSFSLVDLFLTMSSDRTTNNERILP